MGDRSQIEWTDATWNPTRGCSKVSEGCRNCYAMRQAIRQAKPGEAYEGLVHSVTGKGPQWTGKIRLVEEALEMPLRWRAPRRIFVNSMSDLFHEGVPDLFIREVYAVAGLTPQHTYQILTKRPERAAELLPRLFGDAARAFPNVWLGTSVEDQAAADQRIPHLLNAPAAIRFLSCEPLLGPVDLGEVAERIGTGSTITFDALNPAPGRSTPLRRGDPRPAINWVIAGGESGPGARPFEVRWAHSLRSQCARAGVPFFLKQLGADVRDRNDRGFDGGNEVDADTLEWIFPDAWPDGTEVEHDPNGFREEYQGAPVRVLLRNRKGGDPEEWPASLRIREFPEARS